MSDLQWLEALRLEREARGKLAAEDETNKGAVSSEVCREWWERVGTLLDLYISIAKSGASPTPQPLELLFALKGMAGYLAVGQIPDPISDVRSRGATQPGPTERRHIAFASAYIQAAKAGKIDDPKPIKRIQDHFGVVRQTAQKWGKREVPESIRMLADSDPDDLIGQTFSAGEIYRQAGRSSLAVVNRNKRQSK